MLVSAVRLLVGPARITGFLVSDYSGQETHEIMLHLQATDMQLFVHLTWKTQGGRPFLGNDQLRQAAIRAVTARIRSHFCQVLAISATACQIDMVVSFPASLSVTDLLRIAHGAAQEALTRLQQTMTGSFREMPRYWGPGYTAYTLNATEAAQAQTYLRQRLAA